MKPQLFGPLLRQEGRARGASSCLAPGCTARRPRPVRGPGDRPFAKPQGSRGSPRALPAVSGSSAAQV